MPQATVQVSATSVFVRGFDDIFIDENIRIIKTPIQTARVNAYAERWVSGLDLIWYRRRVECFCRPHRGLNLATPHPATLTSASGGPIRPHRPPRRPPP